MLGARGSSASDAPPARPPNSAVDGWAASGLRFGTSYSRVERQNPALSSRSVDGSNPGGTMKLRYGLWVAVWLALWPACAFAQQTGTISGKVVGSDGLVLPGVTVEARSTVLPTPRVTVTGGTGDYRLPALQPGPYTLTFTLSGMGTVTKEAEVKLQQETVGERHHERPGRDRDGERDGADHPAHREGLDRAQERRQQPDDRVAAGRPAVPRPGQADPRRAVHRGQRARPERGRQRPGQRLQVRRRQRHAAAVRHAVGRAGLARHRRGDHHQGRRQGGGLRSRGRLQHRLDQQVRDVEVRGVGPVPVPGRVDGGRSSERRRVVLRAEPGLAHRQHRRSR